MRVTRYDATEPVRRGQLDSNTVARLDGGVGFAELLTTLDAIRAEQRPARVLCTLDDLDQCVYTSGHAGQDRRLSPDAAEAETDPADPAAVRRADEARVGWVAAALATAAAREDRDELPEPREGGPAEIAALLALNADPDLALDEVVLVRRVPVPRDDLVIAGLPNGYFQGDWDTFQNHAVIRRLAGHGYRHIGIGTTLLGFDRASAPTAAEAGAVIADLARLYGTPEHPGWAALADLLRTRRTLLLGYTEDFADVTADASAYTSAEARAARPAPGS
ncbi:hypothetical protein RM844_19000 [Streptomyces sp. DSM 44915]|uniref:Uncharacterized protein n=1 Tax=Streptomyces chisholmiae TaxID=3075540 RepID=A0ABU2JTR0_9ACTN|nr:hypothetical protein [Streptomyces sp. DSM 44915]MDT0268375.1 hypothetical protein [Streptomyces sp. DSM 44915]